MYFSPNIIPDKIIAAQQIILFASFCKVLKFFIRKFDCLIELRKNFSL